MSSSGSYYRLPGGKPEKGEASIEAAIRKRAITKAQKINRLLSFFTLNLFTLSFFVLATQD
ncbi:MuT/NUDIX protein [Methanosarcina mazei Tuc01]|uniref:MuT/NUDIX protein n=1 Tax=Methanosarcina mazei Tuc01 TaxID=1236903 RepID=M1PC34_METMZ|nr:MuT/NUDIX protein [Methanosarcina mazei Tuc01]